MGQELNAILISEIYKKYNLEYWIMAVGTLVVIVLVGCCCWSSIFAVKKDIVWSKYVIGRYFDNFSKGAILTRELTMGLFHTFLVAALVIASGQGLNLLITKNYHKAFSVSQPNNSLNLNTPSAEITTKPVHHHYHKKNYMTRQ